MAVRMIPSDVLDESRLKADEWMESSASKPRSLVGAAVILALWTLVAAAFAFWLVGSPAPEVVAFKPALV